MKIKGIFYTNFDQSWIRNNLISGSVWGESAAVEADLRHGRKFGHVDILPYDDNGSDILDRECSLDA